MDMLYINVTEIVAVLVVGALLMVPVLGLTLRLALSSITDALGRGRAARPEPTARAYSPHTHRHNGAGAERRPDARSMEDDIERELVALDL
jgi:hypothetical protein